MNLPEVMNALNTVAVGLIFLIWSRKDTLNFLIKAGFFALLVFNVVNLVKLGQL